MRLRALLPALTLLAALAAPASATAASPGAAGLNDRLAPGLGNGGYDVLHYDLDLRYATSAPSQSIDGSVTIVAKATQSLSRFNLDFGGQAVGAVSVDGARRRSGATARSSSSPHAGRSTDARSSSYASPTSSRRRPRRATSPSRPPSSSHPTGSATAPQPYFAHLIYPSNDHPRDKASFTFRFDVPAGTEAVANGLPLGHWTSRGRTVWAYVQREPMATELTQLAVGDYDLTTPRPVPRCPAARRHRAQPHELPAADPRARAGRTSSGWRSGSAAIRSTCTARSSPTRRLGFALETQTLSLYDDGWFTETPRVSGSRR